MYYIITNYGGGQNYTPSLFTKEDEAYGWYYELIAQELMSRDFITNPADELNFDNLTLTSTPSVDKLLDNGFIVWTGHGYVIGAGEGENVVELFAVEPSEWL